MKHNLKVTAIILLMFLITQFIGLYVVNYYSGQDLPYGMGVQEVQEQNYTPNFISIIIAFVIAICFLFLLTRFKAKFFLRIWFFFVVMVALGMSLISILDPILPSFQGISIMALVIALPLALSKIASRNILTHNFTELLIYPGIAAVFVPLLNVLYVSILLVLIALYDAWAVWKSGIMQKMAKYQMNEMKVFGGFMIPYLSKAQRKKYEKIKKSKSKSKKEIKVNVAILGGGDVIFPIIASGVMLKTFGVWPAVLVILGALLGLSYLLFFGKKKMYPAMPFISSGIILMIGLSYLVW